MKNRYGNIVGGKYHYVHNQRFETWFPISPNESIQSLTPIFPETDTNFEYTSRRGGVWDLSCAADFPKNSNKIYPAGYKGLTEPIDLVTQADLLNEWVVKNVNIARFANRSARVVLQAKQRVAVTNPYSFIFGLDLISVSGTNYGFEASTEGFEVTTTETHRIPYPSLTWTAMSSTLTRGRISRANTLSPTAIITTGSGNGNFIVQSTFDSTYGELTNNTLWMRSPVVALGASPTLSFSFYFYITSTHNIYVHLDLQ